MLTLAAAGAALIAAQNHREAPPAPTAPLQAQAGRPSAAQPLLNAAYEALTQLDLEGADEPGGDAAALVAEATATGAQASAVGGWGMQGALGQRPQLPCDRCGLGCGALPAQHSSVTSFAVPAGLPPPRLAPPQVLVLLAWCTVEAGEPENALSCLQVGGGWARCGLEAAEAAGGDLHTCMLPVHRLADSLRCPALPPSSLPHRRRCSRWPTPPPPPTSQLPSSRCAVCCSWAGEGAAWCTAAAGCAGCAASPAASRRVAFVLPSRSAALPWLAAGPARRRRSCSTWCPTLRPPPRPAWRRWQPRWERAAAWRWPGGRRLGCCGRRLCRHCWVAPLALSGSDSGWQLSPHHAAH